jgi:hypothetical protein
LDIGGGCADMIALGYEYIRASRTTQFLRVRLFVPQAPSRSRWASRSRPRPCFPVRAMCSRRKVTRRDSDTDTYPGTGFGF